MRRLLPRLLAASLIGSSFFGLTVGLGSADGDYTNLADHKLEAFITAALAVDNVMDRWQPEIVRADDEGEAQQLRAKANAEIREAIEKAEGISLDEYQNIRKAIVADPEMMTRVTDIMRRKQDR